MEFRRLVDATIARLHSQDPNSQLVQELRSDCEFHQLRALACSLGGVTVLLKSERDLLSAGNDVFVLEAQGSPRR